MIRALHVGTALAGLALATVTLLAPPAHAQDQSTEIPVSFSLAGPVPACAVGSSTDLDYGTVIRGGSSEWVYVNERTGAASTSGGIATPSSATVGYARVTASNATSLTVTRAYPTGLGPLTFNGDGQGHPAPPGLTPPCPRPATLARLRVRRITGTTASAALWAALARARRRGPTMIALTSQSHACNEPRSTHRRHAATGVRSPYP